ncbi:PrsW family intramembrane metalloprotease [Haloarculaceae archaeon H-GB1-1]|nr:PrsW family intramembrane metalloprotease [Haloarculaceae archaeon H-GB1-1]
MGAGRWLRTRSRNVLRIGRWEITKNAGGVDKRTILVAAVAMVGLAAMAPVAANQGVALDSGLYRVGVEPSSPYYGAVAADPTFVVQAPSPEAVEKGRQEVLIQGGTVADYARTQKGRAALAELRSTVQRYNDARMVDEPNQSAAFPVLVDLRYVDRDVSQIVVPNGESGSDETGSDSGTDLSVGTETDGASAGDGTSTASGDGGGSSGGDDGGSTAEGTAGTATDGDDDGSTGTDSGEDGSTGADGDDATTTATDTDGDQSGGLLGSVGDRFTASLSGGGVSGTPSDIQPPFPFRSLVLAFVFVLPLNFIIQAYGSTMLSERIKRRGELLLVAPVSRGDIIVGKTLPYFAAAIGIAAVIALGLDGGAVSVLAVAPLAMLFLSATFLGAMFARSFKELTFVTVTVTVSLTTYAFVPAIFTDVTPIALISPLTIVVRDLQGQAIGLGELAFSTLPPTATALVLFGLGAGLYREEDMFTQRPIPLKVLDALAGRIKRKRSVAFVTAILLPFVLVTELVAIAGLFALQALSLRLTIVLTLVAVAVIEEVAKSLHVYAGYVHAKFDRSLRTALTVGALSGVGFFLVEKLSLIVRLADLMSLDIGRAAFNESALSGPVVLSFLLAPLALHVVTASISAVGARRSRESYFLALLVAIAVHVAYNLTVVMVLGWQ